MIDKSQMHLFLSHWAEFRREPYRLFFPMGIALAALGMGIWIPYYFLPHALPYPGAGHAFVQIQGFLLCFILGFLGTMLPKALGVAPLGPWQFAFFPLGFLGAALLALTGFYQAAEWIHLLLILNFVLFILRRLPQRQATPPPPFILIALAMFSDLAGTLSRILSISGIGGAPGLRIASLLQFQAFPLLLVLGVGSFLLPKLLGNATVTPESLRDAAKAPWQGPLAMGLLFLASFILEAAAAGTSFGSDAMRLGAGLRSGVWVWFLIRTLALHRTPRKLPAYLQGARLSLWTMGLGLAMPVFLPGYALAWEHIVFITGLLWITLSVAARVMSAHAGRLDSLALHPGKSLGYGILIVLAMVTRVCTDVWTGSHWLHMALAAAFGLAALGLWGRIYLPLMLDFPGRRRP